MTTDDRAPAGLTWFLIAAAALYAALFLYYVAATRVIGPVYDVLDWAVAYAEHALRGDWLGYLWMPHNEHRIAWARLLLALDLQQFGGRNQAFLVSGIGLLLAMVGVLVWAVLASPFRAATRTVAGALVVLLLLPSTIATMCSMPGMQVFLHQSAFATFAIVLMTQNHPAAKALALPVAALAALGGAGGLLVWPVLIYLALRSGWRWIAATAMAGALFAALYAFHLPVAPARPSDDWPLLQWADYVLRFLGLPWAHAPALVWPGRLIGAVILLLGATLVLRDVAFGRAASRLERIGTGLIMFAFLIATAAAISRSAIATDREMPIRYTLFVALGHVGLLLAAMPFIDELLARFRRTMSVAIVALVATLLVQQVVAGQAAKAEIARYNDAWRRFLAGEWTPEMEHYLYPDREQALQRLEVLRRAQLYDL